jgi:hypothetical protein
LRGDIGAIFDRFWLLLSENPDVHPPKNDPLSQEMHLKILSLSNGRFINQTERLGAIGAWGG